MDSSKERRILAELVYERVRASVNLCQLIVLEQELERGIERAMSADARSDPGGEEHQDLARGYMEEAWRRLENEWRRLRDDVDEPFD